MSTTSVPSSTTSTLPPLTVKDRAVKLPTFDQPIIVWTKKGFKPDYSVPVDNSDDVGSVPELSLNVQSYRSDDGTSRTKPYISRRDESVMIIPTLHRSDGTKWTMFLQESRPALGGHCYAGLIISQELEGYHLNDVASFQNALSAFNPVLRNALTAGAKELEEEAGLHTSIIPATQGRWWSFKEISELKDGEQGPQPGDCVLRSIAGPYAKDSGTEDCRQYTMGVDIYTGDLGNLPDNKPEDDERIRRIPVEIYSELRPALALVASTIDRSDKQRRGPNVDYPLASSVIGGFRVFFESGDHCFPDVSTIDEELRARVLGEAQEEDTTLSSSSHESDGN